MAWIGFDIRNPEDCGLECRAAVAAQTNLAQRVRQLASDARPKYEVPGMALANRGAGMVTITYALRSTEHFLLPLSVLTLGWMDGSVFANFTRHSGRVPKTLYVHELIPSPVEGQSDGSAAPSWRQATERSGKCMDAWLRNFGIQSTGR